jgi:hypothetical protein
MRNEKGEGKIMRCLKKYTVGPHENLSTYFRTQPISGLLLSMSELIDESHQLLIISHNAEIIDSNPSKGFLFWRDNHGSSVRCGLLDIPKGLTAGEALTRGWVVSGGNKEADNG